MFLASTPTLTLLVLRRLAFLLPALLLSGIGSFLAWQMLATAPSGHLPDTLDLLAYSFFCLLFALLAFTAWPMLLGIVLWLAGRRHVSLEHEALAIPRKQLVPSRTTRTAILVPAYHEDAHEVFARVRVMHASLAALQPAGQASDIDIFVLSDSQNPAAITTEAAAYRACVATLSHHGPAIYYRRRANNTDYKVGNLKEFCTRWGSAYDHLLVLDADSLMAGETIRRLIILLERHPQIGLLQTSFMPVGRDTLFCRIMQFSARLYLIPSAMGLELWQGANANYWGHNALFRTKAFTASCGLPVLPGAAPLGGRILSHDIVEAAFIARAGWQAWLLPNLPGTYEELPTNLIDFMQRDRRWCAGNLQHQHIIRAHGVPFGNRLHMVLGILSYVAGPLWLAFFLLSLAGLLTHSSASGIQLATAGFFNPSPAGTALFRLSAALLFGPKLLILTATMLQPTARKGFGGGLRLLASAVLEQLFVILQQPVVMLFYTTFVVTTLCGTVVKWEAQPRSERGITWQEALLRHQYHLIFAATVAGLLAVHNPHQVLWLAPVLVGLLGSPLFTVATSRASLGRLARRCQLFLTIDETAPAPELRALHKLLAQPTQAPKGVVSLPRLPATAPCLMPAQLLRQPAAASGHQGLTVLPEESLG